MRLYKNLNEAIREREKVKALKVSVKGEDFPEELFHFSQLEELYLDGNCRTFPKEPSAWSALRTLSLKWPCFNGDLSFVFALPSLENLTIKDCELEELPLDLSMLWKIHEMNLSGNRLSKLPPTFPELTNLKRLNLDQNQFETFPDLVKSMKSLHHLSIDQNLFSEEEKARIQRLFHIWTD
jgi:Leucine-rich repeat (LRR) protein